MSEDKIEIHIVLEGHGVDKGAELLRDFQSGSFVSNVTNVTNDEKRKALVESEPEETPTPAARKFSQGAVCSECQYGQVEDMMSNPGYCDETVSHNPTCSEYRGV